MFSQNIHSSPLFLSIHPRQAAPLALPLSFIAPFLNAASAVTECSRKHYALEHYFLIVYLHKWSINIHSTAQYHLKLLQTLHFIASVYFSKGEIAGGSICGCCFAPTCVSIDSKGSTLKCCFPDLLERILVTFRNDWQHSAVLPGKCSDG